jgi:protein O-GlcNAc transferase
VALLTCGAFKQASEPKEVALMLSWFKSKFSASHIPPVPVPAAKPPNSAQADLPEVANVSELISEAMRLYAGGDYDLSTPIFEQVLRSEPRNLIALYQIANAHCARAEYQQGKAACQLALGALPDQPDLLVLMATIDGFANSHDAALAALQRARKVKPDFPRIDLKIAEVLCTLGRGTEAIAAFDKAIAIEPDALDITSFRLFFLNYFGLLDQGALFEEHRKWGATVDQRFAHLRETHANDTSPDRPLRIGLVSGDLRHHAVAYFLEGYLREHDRVQYPIHCFDTSPYSEDNVTADLRNLTDGWYRVAALNDDQLCEEIRKQAIDILVDLSGHTMHNRLLTFSRRPAPVQVGWFGYMNTTGLTSIDYRLTDRGHDPEVGANNHYTEKLYYLPSLACFSPPAGSPDVSPAPFLTRGTVTFLSANQWTKVTESVKDLWAEILGDESKPRLRIIATSAASEQFRQDVTKEFVRRGVDSRQIEVLPRMKMPEFQASFSEVDVALDPFPYGGGTTTLHTIWMGVPIVAMQGDSELGRATPEMLRGFGIPDFVATSHAEYRDKAIALARDPSPLVEIRAHLRQRMAASAAGDSIGLTRNVENAFRTMWHGYCASSSKRP